MTTDTERALDMIRPIARELNIDITADNHCLYVDDPYIGEAAIGIGCNSTYATLMEFIGLLVLRHANDRGWEPTAAQVKRIKRYWTSSEVLEKLKEWRAEHAEG